MVLEDNECNVNLGSPRAALAFHVADEILWVSVFQETLLISSIRNNTWQNICNKKDINKKLETLKLNVFQDHFRAFTTGYWLHYHDLICLDNAAPNFT